MKTRILALFLALLLTLTACGGKGSSDQPQGGGRPISGTVIPDPTLPSVPTPPADPTPSVQPTVPVDPTPSVQPTVPVDPTPSVQPTTPAVTPTPTPEDPYTKKYEFSYGAAKDGKPHSITVSNQKLFDSFANNTLAWDNKTEGKVLYLTFDCGYSYEDCIPSILNTLQEKGVKATFFCTTDYLNQDPNSVQRMINEGHIVGNHSVNHPSDCAALTDAEMTAEVMGVHNQLKSQFNYDCKYFRFPGGVYSNKVLDTVYSLNYRTVFWSIAHADWDPANQPSYDKAFKTVTGRLHPGAVILLHSTAPTNVAMLGEFIDYCRAQGYEFRSLDEYAFWK